MKKILLILIFSVTGFGLFADGMKFDGTAFMSLGLYDDETSSAEDDLELFFESLRFGFTGILRYEVLPIASVGVESGVGLMSYDGGDTMLFDIPVNVVGRLGFNFVFFEAHAGYNYSNISELAGPTTGLKVGLGDVFIDATSVFAETQYMKYTVGYQLLEM